MNAQSFDIRRILYKTNTTKKWWIPALLFTVIAINGLGMLKPAKFTASSLVLIHQAPISTYSVQQTFNTNDTLNTLREQITSPQFLAEIARKLNLDRGLDPQSREYDKLIARMQKNIELMKSPEMFKVEYSGFTPQEAYNVTDMIINQFIAQSANFYNNRVAKSLEVYKSQLEQAILQEKSAQTAIKLYKDKYITEIPEARAGYMDRMNKTQNDYDNNQASLLKLRNDLQQAIVQIASIPETVKSETSQVDNTVRLQLEQAARELKMKIENMTQVQGMTEEHWDVVAARKTLAQINDQLSSASTTQKVETKVEANPLYADKKSQILNLQVQISSIEKQLPGQQAAMKELDEYLKKIPQREQELSTLDRDYATAKDQVTELRRRVSDAQQASYAEANGGGPSFEVRSPPRLPTYPSSPNRVKIALMSVFAGCGVAGAIIMLFVVMDRTLRSLEEARMELRMPLLGMVQRIVTPSQLALARRRRMRRILATAIVFLVLAGAGFAAFHVYHDDVVLGIGQMREFMMQM